MVREISPDFASSERCMFLGVVDGGAGAMTIDWEMHEDALNRVRNHIAEMGGNAYSVSLNTGNSIQVDAYNCI
ncbi:MAG: hypothetical protein V2I24_09040 [Halieaceae bacterium]|nr:hypothetical protein [Halieaceae bacterium]